MFSEEGIAADQEQRWTMADDAQEHHHAAAKCSRKTDEALAKEKELEADEEELATMANETQPVQEDGAEPPMEIAQSNDQHAAKPSITMAAALSSDKSKEAEHDHYNLINIIFNYDNNNKQIKLIMIDNYNEPIELNHIILW